MAHFESAQVAIHSGGSQVKMHEIRQLPPSSFSAGCGALGPCCARRSCGRAEGYCPSSEERLRAVQVKACQVKKREVQGLLVERVMVTGRQAPAALRHPSLRRSSPLRLIKESKAKGAARRDIARLALTSCLIKEGCPAVDCL